MKTEIENEEIENEEARDARQWEREQLMKEAAENAINCAGLEIDPDSTYPIHVDGDVVAVSIYAIDGIDFSSLHKLSGIVRELVINGTYKFDVLEIKFKLLGA